MWIRPHEADKFLYWGPLPVAKSEIALPATTPLMGDRGHSRLSKTSTTGSYWEHFQLLPSHRGNTRTPIDLFCQTLVMFISLMEIFIWATLWFQISQGQLP